MVRTLTRAQYWLTNNIPCQRLGKFCPDYPQSYHLPSSPICWLQVLDLVQISCHCTDDRAFGAGESITSALPSVALLWEIVKNQIANQTSEGRTNEPKPLLKRHKKRRGTSPIANSYMMQPSKMIAIYVGKVQGLHLQGNFIRKLLSCDFNR